MAASYYHDLIVELSVACAAYLANIVDPSIPKDSQFKPAGEVSRYQSPGRLLESREARVDAALRFDGDPVRIVLLEAQLRRDDRKPSAWTLYLTLSANRYDAHADLIILVVDLKTAEWAAKATDKRTGISFPRHVIGPHNLSISDGKREIKNHFPFSMLCMAIHKNREEAEDLYSAIWEVIKTGLPLMNGDKNKSSQTTTNEQHKDPRLASHPFHFYINAIRHCATPAWRKRVMERDMQYITFTDSLILKGQERGIAIGEKRGEKRGERRGSLRTARQMIQRVAAANRVTLSDDCIARLNQEQDLERLEAWLIYVSAHKNAAVVLPD